MNSTAAERRLCIIPARGGSKRIPRKNIRSFLGKPIIAYSIEAARASGLFTEVMVSTDDGEIAEVAQKYSATVPTLRSRQNSNDTATTVAVLREVLSGYRDRGHTFDAVCCLYATAPFISSQLLDRGLALLLRETFDTVFPVVRFGSPIQRALTVGEGGKVSLLQHEYRHSRSQDLVPAYHDAGMFYWFRPAAVLDAGTLWTDNSGSIVLTELETQDIDSPIDWRLAELKYQLLHDHS